LSSRRLLGAAVLAAFALLAIYLLPRVGAPSAHWPLWDVSVYWWGGRQAAHGLALYGSGARYSFTYPPFAAAVFGAGGEFSVGVLKAALTVASAAALPVLCWATLRAAGVRGRAVPVFAATALALLLAPVDETLRLGEVNLILAAMIGVDLLGRRDGARGQGVLTGLAAGIKLTPLIFVAYLLLTRRARAALTAAASFAATVAIGWAFLPDQSWTFWPGGVFLNEHRVGDPVNPTNQSLSGVAARFAGGLGTARPWWLAAALVTGVAGLAIAAWAHRSGHRLAGFVCCGVTGLLVSPFSWTHHWVWAVSLLVMLAVMAYRRRSLRWGLAAVAVAAVFSGRIPMPWPGHDPDLGPLLVDAVYVLCGLAVLAGTAIALARERGAERAGIAT
jgi:alpha-1,2-mannosyltransferase